MRVDFDLAPVADRIAERVAEIVLERLNVERSTPWMLMDEAITYTRIPEGTFRKWVAEGRIPSHGGKRRLFHRGELDVALGYSGASAAEVIDIAGARVGA